MPKPIINLFTQIFKSKAGKSSLIYTGTNFFNAALPFLLLPVLTAYLTESEYGIATMIMVFVSVITPLLTLGVTGSIALVYHKKEVEDFPMYIGNCFFIAIFTSVILFLILQLLSSFVQNTSGIPESWVASIVFIGLFNFIIELNLMTYKIQYKSKAFAIIKIAQTIFTFGLTYYLIVFGNFRWEGIIIAKIVILIIFSVLSVYFLIKNKLIRFKFNKEYIKYALIFGIPLIPHLLSGFIVNFSDRLFITSYLGLAETGSYTVSYQIGSVMDLICVSFNLAWAPWLFSKLENFNHNKPLLKRITTLGVFGILIFAGVLIFITPDILHLFVSEKFNVSKSIISIIVGGFVFQGLYLIFVNYLFYLKSTKQISLITISVALLNLVLNFILIPTFGLFGAAWATLISFGLKALIIFFIANKNYPIYG